MSKPCYHCELVGADHPGDATATAVWVGPDGQTDGVWREICDECLRAGDPTGPGYRISDYWIGYCFDGRVYAPANPKMGFGSREEAVAFARDEGLASLEHWVDGSTIDADAWVGDSK